MRKFEKISENRFMIDIEKAMGLTTEDLENNVELKSWYNSIRIPERSTSKSAGYDIRAVGNWIIEPGQQVKIPTGLKVSMEDNEVLLIFVRSSLGVKHSITLSNTVGVIDADYYNNPDNEGHFWLTLKNKSNENFIIDNGDRLCQGIFVDYKVTDDDNATKTREGGFGSTGSN